jgi:hypothetical protein
MPGAESCGITTNIDRIEFGGGTELAPAIRDLILTGDGPPRLELFLAGAERAYARLDAVLVANNVGDLASA